MTPLLEFVLEILVFNRNYGLSRVMDSRFLRMMDLHLKFMHFTPTERAEDGRFERRKRFS